MKYMTIYAIVDTVAETVVSVFPSINDENATRIFKQATEKVGDVAKKDYVLEKTASTFVYPETFSDVTEIKEYSVDIGDDSNE